MLEHEAFAIAIINPFTFQVLLFLLLVRFGFIHTAVLHFFFWYTLHTISISLLFFATAYYFLSQNSA